MITRFIRKYWPDEPVPILPISLLCLTFTTGIVDSISYVMLGHVFVANMTGNVAFIGLAAAGATSISLVSTLISLGCFLIGAFAGGKIARRYSGHRFALLFWASLCMLVPILITFALSIAWGNQLSAADQYLSVALLAIAMGIQGAAARAVAAADLTTLVLTSTLVTLVTDTSKTSKRVGAVRRVLSVLTMIAGAAVGTIFTVQNNMTIPLGLIIGLVAIVAFVGYIYRHPTKL